MVKSGEPYYTNIRLHKINRALNRDGYYWGGNTHLL